MEFIGLLAFIFIIIANSEISTLKKKIRSVGEDNMN